MMETAINLLSVIPMRKEPSHKSEMVSQLLFGEYAELFEEKEHFVRIKCLYDGYEGWVQLNQLTQADKIFVTDAYTGDWIREVLVNEVRMRIPLGTPVYLQEPVYRFNQSEVRYLSSSGDKFWKSGEENFTTSNLKTIYQGFLNTPYLWGGKSVFGIDCSGFVQQVFKMFDKKLLRDAYLQAGQGEAVQNLSESKEGDLAFFHNESGRVIHVGIILENNRIVHASGKVRIDTIDEQGIVNVETGNRTHRLHSVKRYF